MALLVASQLALPVIVEASELRVGVIPFSGNADPTARTQATQIFMDALAGMRGIAVVSFANVDAVLGPAAKRALDECKDDRCLISATAGIKTDGLAIGSIDEEGSRTILRVRLVKTSSDAQTVGRVSRDISLESDALRAEVSQTALELFPDHAKASVGMLEIHGALPGARIVVDGKQSATVPLNPTDPNAPAVLRLPPGTHQIRVTAEGHYPVTERAEVLAGQRTRVRIDLDKNRSNGPLILGGIGAAAGIAGAVLGVVVKSKADDWDEACAGGTACAAGFTRERYEDDGQAIDRGRTVANVLYGVAGAAAISAVIWYFLDPGSDPEVAE
jgi:hypothetical protein